MRISDVFTNLIVNWTARTRPPPLLTNASWHKLTKLDRTLAAQVTMLSLRCNEIYETSQTKTGLLESGLQQQRQHFTEVCAKVDHKFTSKNEAQDELFDDHRRDVASVCTKLDSKFSADVIALDERVQANHQHCLRELAAQGARGEEQLRSLDTRFTHLHVAQDEQLRQKNAEQDQEVRERFAQTTEHHSTLQRVVAEQVVALEEKIAVTCITLDRKFTRENSEQHTQIEENHKHCVDALAKLERQLLEQTQSLDDKLSNECAKLEQWSKGKLKEHDDRMQLEHEKSDQLNNTLHSKLTTGFSDADRKLTNVQAQLSAKLTEWATRCDGRAEDHYSYFSGVFTGLDKKLVSLDTHVTPPTQK